MLKRISKFILKTVLIIVLAVNLVIIFSGRFYLYKGIWNTYLKGHSGPSATEYLIFANRKIEALNPVPLKKSKLYNLAKLPTQATSILNDYKAIAFVVVKNDSLIHEQYWDNFSDTSHTNSFSMAKTYCGVLLGCALTDGFIKSLDEPVSKYIPEFLEGKKSKITLRYLTTMTSGIDFDESYINPFAYPAEGYFGTDILKVSCAYEMKGAPGETFNYVSGNSALLGICISKAVGKPLSQYLSERLWKDLECRQPAWWSLDRKDGQEKGFCCLNSNAVDFSRLGILYLNGGKYSGKQIIDSQFVANSIIPSACKEKDGTPNRTYGYNWWLTNYKGENIFYARGILGQYIICVPAKKMVIVKLAGKKRPLGNNHYPDDVALCIDAATEMYK